MGWGETMRLGLAAGLAVVVLYWMQYWFNY